MMMQALARMRTLMVPGLLCLALLAMAPSTLIGGEPDPSGTKTGSIVDVPAARPGSPTLQELGDAVGHNRVAINFIWTLITGFLVMFMQAGFALVETGLCRAKNAGHTMAMNFMIYPLGMLGFYLCGFAFMFGGLGPIGTAGRLRRAEQRAHGEPLRKAVRPPRLERVPAAGRRL